MRLLVVAALALLAGAGCGGGGGSTELRDSSVAAAEPPAKRPQQAVEPSHCPAAAVPGCRETVGEIVYIERVDPDGDGDAHFVIVDPQGITLPDLTAIDVRAGLRPHPLPGPGDLVSAAGPVQTGSYGQDQIHALELRVGH